MFNLSLFIRIPEITVMTKVRQLTNGPAIESSKNDIRMIKIIACKYLNLTIGRKTTVSLIN